MSGVDVFASVGTDHHRFDRLIGWLDSWAIDHPEASCLVQYGRSRPPTFCGGVDFLESDTLRETLRSSATIVSHGGPATIAEARSAGRVPICVPRDPRYGEHVDEHQQLFSRRIAKDHVVLLAETEKELHLVLDAARADPASLWIDVDDEDDNGLRPAVRKAGELIADLLRQRDC